MAFHKFTLCTIILTLSSLPSLAELVAGVEFGDSREVVEKKLKASPLFTATLNKTLFGRTGLNGAFKSTTTLDGLQYSLYYDWSNDDQLEQFNYHSENLPITSYDSDLKSSWSYVINVLSTIHGKATNAGPFPKESKMTMDAIYFTHEWKTDTGYLYFGPGLEKKGYNLVITFTKDPLTPLE